MSSRRLLALMSASGLIRLLFEAILAGVGTALTLYLSSTTASSLNSLGLPNQRWYVDRTKLSLSVAAGMAIVASTVWAATVLFRSHARPVRRSQRFGITAAIVANALSVGAVLSTLLSEPQPSDTIAALLEGSAFAAVAVALSSALRQLGPHASDSKGRSEPGVLDQ